MNDAKSKIENKNVFTNAIREEIRSYQFEISEESNEFEDLQMICEGLTKNGNAEKFYSKYYATIALQATKYFTGLSRNSATLLATARRPSKGGSLVALLHPFVYLCRLTSGGNCRCRFSVQIHMSLSLQEFVSDVSLQ